MKKRMLTCAVFIWVIAIVCSMTTTSYVQAASLDDLIGDEGERYSGSGIMDDLSQAADMSSGQEGAKKAGKTIERVVSFAVQVLSYVITAGLTLRVVCDLAYIGVPPLRLLLANGHQGAPAGGQQQGQQGQMGQQGMMGAGGMMGGYGRGGMMGMNGMNGMNGQMGQQGMQQPGMGKIQLVSNAALTAVASETMPGPDGKPQSAFRIYIGDMAVVLVVTPILLTLALTGVLTQLGFFIGAALSNGISGFIS